MVDFVELKEHPRAGNAGCHNRRLRLLYALGVAFAEKCGKEAYGGGLTKINTEFDQIRNFLLWELEV